MLYKQICTIALSTYAFLPATYGSIYYVHTNATANYRCPDTTTCNIYCDTDLATANIYDCDNASECHFHCDEKKCAADSIIHANNSNTLNITQDLNGQECLSGAIINAPNNGSAYFSTQSKVGFKAMSVYAGANTQSIIIDTSSARQDNKKDDYQDMNIYASTAQYVHIILAEGFKWSSGTVECPLNSSYNDSTCVIEAHGELGTVEIIANDGINVISDNPTPSPTIEPTVPTTQPSISPTTPTFTPTNNPTSSPTSGTIAPTIAPTIASSNTPTIAPTTAPSNTPSTSPTLGPITYSFIGVTLSPTLEPTFPTSSNDDTDSEDTFLDGFVLTTSSIILIGICVFIGICCIFISVYYYKQGPIVYISNDISMKDNNDIDAAYDERISYVQPHGIAKVPSLTPSMKRPIDPPFQFSSEAFGIQTREALQPGQLTILDAVMDVEPPTERTGSSGRSGFHNHRNKRREDDLMSVASESRTTTVTVQSVVSGSNRNDRELEMNRLFVLKSDVVHGEAEECEEASDSDDLWIQSEATDMGDRHRDKRNKAMNEENKVSVWMEDVVKLAEYTQLLIANGFDTMDAIGEIRMEDLVSMGIQKMGHRRKILKLAKELN